MRPERAKPGRVYTIRYQATENRRATIRGRLLDLVTGERTIVQMLDGRHQYHALDARRIIRMTEDRDTTRREREANA